MRVQDLIFAFVNMLRMLSYVHHYLFAHLDLLSSETFCF